MLALQRRVQTIDEKASLAVQPAFLLDEIEGEQSREDQQRFGGGCVGALARELRAQRRVDIAYGIAKAFEELPRQRFAIEGPIEQARVIGAGVRGEEVEAIDRVHRWMSQVDIEATQIAIRREVVQRDRRRAPRDERRLSQNVVARERSQKSLRCLPLGQIESGDDVAVEHSIARGEIKR